MRQMWSPLVHVGSIRVLHTSHTGCSIQTEKGRKMSNNHKVGGIIDAIKTAVQGYGVDPHSPVVIRIGKNGPEMLIEHVKVQGTLTGPKVILQAKFPGK